MSLVFATNSENVFRRAKTRNSRHVQDFIFAPEKNDEAKTDKSSSFRDFPKGNLAWNQDRGSTKLLFYDNIFTKIALTKNVCRKELEATQLIFLFTEMETNLLVYKIGQTADQMPKIQVNLAISQRIYVSCDCPSYKYRNGILMSPRTHNETFFSVSGQKSHNNALTEWR